MRPVVNTEKHYLQVSLATVASGSITPITLVFAEAVPTAVSSVREGAKISAIYIELWVTGDDAVQSSGIITLEKRNGTAVAMTAAQSASLGTYVNKKNVFFTQMGLFPSNTTYPMASIKGWFKIPKSKQRFGLNDVLVINVHGQSDGLQFCGFSTYKEQY